MKAALAGLQAIYKPGFNNAKAGVMLLDLQDGAIEQHELDLAADPEQSSALMGTLDKLNDRFGRGTVLLASAGLEGQARTWSMRRNLLTPQYTTRWDDFPVAVA